MSDDRDIKTNPGKRTRTQLGARSIRVGHVAETANLAHDSEPKRGNRKQSMSTRGKFVNERAVHLSQTRRWRTTSAVSYNLTS